MTRLRVFADRRVGYGVMLFCWGAGASVDASDKEENMRCSRRMIGRALGPRAGMVLLSALMLTGCASALAVRVPKAGPERPASRPPRIATSSSAWPSRAGAVQPPSSARPA